MANAYPPKLTLLERLDLIPANISLIAAGIYAALTGIFRGNSGAKVYSKHISYAVIRKMLQRLSTRQNQYVSSFYCLLDARFVCYLCVNAKGGF